MQQFSFNGPSASVLKAVDLSKPVDKNSIEVLIYGGSFWDSGPFAGSSKMFRIKPLADNPTWDQDDMPTGSILRWAINLPNGKVHCFLFWPNFWKWHPQCVVTKYYKGVTFQ